MFPVLPPLGGVRLLGRAAVTAVNHNNVISLSYWSQGGEGRALCQACRESGDWGNIISIQRIYSSFDCLTPILTDIFIVHSNVTKNYNSSSEIE